MKGSIVLLLLTAALLSACIPASRGANSQAQLTELPKNLSPVSTQSPATTGTPNKGTGESMEDVLNAQTPVGGKNPAVPQPKVSWDTSPEALVLSATNCCGMVPEFVRLNYIPDAQIWGDGRILWTQLDANNQRRVLEGRLAQDRLAALLQGAVDQGFFGWKELYTDPNAPTDLPTRCVYIQLQSGSRKACEYFSGAPQAFHDLYDQVAEGAGVSGLDFVPEKGYLTTYPQPNASPNPAMPAWDAQAAGISLANAGKGAWIEGAALETAWKVLNQNPFGAAVREGDGVYMLSLQVPGVSLSQPPGQ